MIDYKNIRLTVAKGLKSYLGCPVIRSNQNAEPPAYPYISYTITTLTTENKGTYGEYEDGIARKGVNSVWSIVAISDDCDESMLLANKAKEYLDYVGTTYLNDNGVIVQAVTNVTNRDNFLTIDYQYRNGFDCFFWCYDSVELPGVESIEAVHLDNLDIIEKEDLEETIDRLNAQLDEANAAFASIEAAIEEKGVDVPDDMPVTAYHTAIQQISGGIVDTELSETSTNAVQNRVITIELAKKQDAQELADATITNLEIEELLKE